MTSRVVAAAPDTPVPVIRDADRKTLTEAVRQPVVREDRAAIATTMTLTLSIDHRAVDGATAVGFLARHRDLIEEPLGIVL